MKALNLNLGNDTLIDLKFISVFVNKLIKALILSLLNALKYYREYLNKIKQVLLVTH